MKKKNIFIGIIIFIISSVTILLIFFKYASKKIETPPKPYSTNNNCKKDDGYCVYTYKGKEYLTLNSGYNGEYDIEFLNINTNDINNIKEFSYLSYAEYSDFCEKYAILKKYDKKDSNYIIYFYSAEVADSIGVKLGDVKYENDKITLFIWDKVYYYGGMYPDDGTRKAYFIIIPTNNIISNYEVKPLIHKTEYNKMAK